MNRRFHLQYRDRTTQSLMIELHEQRTAREKAESELTRYREAFTWLEQQEWFQNHRHTLAAYLKDKNIV